MSSLSRSSKHQDIEGIIVKIFTLEHRRLNWYIIDIFKYLKNDHVEKLDFFWYVNPKASQDGKLQKPVGMANIQKFKKKLFLFSPKIRKIIKAVCNGSAFWAMEYYQRESGFQSDGEVEEEVHA